MALDPPHLKASLSVTIDGTTQLVTPISWTLNGAVLSLSTSTRAISRNASTITFTNAGTQTVSVATSFSPNDINIAGSPNQVIAGGSTSTTLTSKNLGGGLPTCTGTRSNAVTVTPTFTYSGGAVCQPIAATTFSDCF